MSVAYGAQQMAELLGLNLRPAKQVTFCPFHSNNDTPAFSVDFSKAQWYCHGECKRGGGVIKFIVEWAKAKDGKEITTQEARRRLNRAFVVPDAATLRARIMDERVDLFVWAMSGFVAHRLLRMERAVAAVRHEPNADEWAELAKVQRVRTWHEQAFDVLVLGQRDRANVLLLMREAVELGIWSNEREIAAREARAKHDAYLQSPEYRELAVYIREQRHKEIECLAHRSPTPPKSSTKRQPLPIRQAVPMRQPI